MKYYKYYKQFHIFPELIIKMDTYGNSKLRNVILIIF